MGFQYEYREEVLFRKQEKRRTTSACARGVRAMHTPVDAGLNISKKEYER